ncbi:hypothetical protein NPIL_457781, partial [Nephila pilipes]
MSLERQKEYGKFTTGKKRTN